MIKPTQKMLRVTIRQLDQLAGGYSLLGFVVNVDNGRPDLGPCWDWSGVKSPVRAPTRRIWERVSGTSIPLQVPKLLVCHTCDRGICGRPAHLWLGTNVENMADAAAKMRLPGFRKRHTLKTRKLIGIKSRAMWTPAMRAAQAARCGERFRGKAKPASQLRRMRHSQHRAFQDPIRRAQLRAALIMRWERPGASVRASKSQRSAWARKSISMDFSKSSMSGAVGSLRYRRLPAERV